MNAFLAVLIVLGLVTVLAWLLRRGSLGALTGRGGAINVETAVALGERRSLVIVVGRGPPAAAGADADDACRSSQSFLVRHCSAARRTVRGGALVNIASICR